MPAASIGLRAKTARAIAVILAEPAEAPVALLRTELIFATPQTPATFQPYHEVMNLPWERAQLAVKESEAALVAAAAAALGRLTSQARADGQIIRSVGIVGAPSRNLDAIASPHIRAHAAEGVLFRRILESAAAENGVECAAYAERDLEGLAMKELGLTRLALREHLSRFGSSLGRPWRADEKLASIGAWLALHGIIRSPHSRTRATARFRLGG
ncbi:MAG TPA: hypothetical protein VE398_23535 [Acidobacteriota bacterium]|nr:hypothetical protein [Acidobacteriota bacterium]